MTMMSEDTILHTLAWGDEEEKKRIERDVYETLVNLSDRCSEYSSVIDDYIELRNEEPPQNSEAAHEKWRDKVEAMEDRLRGCC